MLQVWTPVIVTSETHERTGQAGTVHATNKAKHSDSVVVNFDLDGTLEAVDLADLKTL